MNLRQVADIAVSRLGLPVPMAKLVTIQALGRALGDEDTAQVFADALADWLASRELESECLEGLSALLATAPSPQVVDRVRRAIARPSLASDLLLSIATGIPTLVATWPGCHSGPAPKLLALEEELRALRTQAFIPPLFTHELESLQGSSGRPFVRQWAFEYSMLRGRHGGTGDGHLDYFLGRDRENVGQFLARRGHLARSAYLRTLACAVEHWNMPEGLAVRDSAIAFPAEPIFLRIAPQAAPAWAHEVHRRDPGETVDASALAHAVIEIVEAKLQRKLMHCSLSVIDAPRCHVELEVFAVVTARDGFDVDRGIGFYHHMLGKASPGRDGLRAFVPADMGSEGMDALGFVPVVLPLVGSSMGYLQSDLVGRVPFVPISTRSVPVELVPHLGGARAVSEGREVGAWDWWLWDWKPSYPKDWGRPTASCTSLDHDAVLRMADDLGGHIQHLWRVEIWQRDRDYGDWVETKHSGRC